MARKEFDRKTRALAYARCGGRCEHCYAKLKTGEAEFYKNDGDDDDGVEFDNDHIRCAANNGPATLENCQILCVPCHKIKTAQDIKDMRRADRARDRQNNCLVRRGPKIQNQGFPPGKTKPALWRT